MAKLLSFGDGIETSAYDRQIGWIERWLKRKHPQATELPRCPMSSAAMYEPDGIERAGFNTTDVIAVLMLYSVISFDDFSNVDVRHRHESATARTLNRILAGNPEVRCFLIPDAAMPPPKPQLKEVSAFSLAFHLTLGQCPLLEPRHF